MKLIDLDFEQHIQNKSSFKRLQNIKLPDKSIEEFKKIDLKHIYEEVFNFNHDSYISLESFEYLKNSDFHTVFIVNSIYLAQHSNINENIHLTTLEKRNPSSPNAFYHLTESFLKSNNHLDIKKNLDKPLLIINISKYHNSFIPSSLVIDIDENISVDIVELFISKNSEKSLFNLNRTLNIQKNSSVNYSTTQSLQPQDTVIFNHTSKIEENSELNIITLDYEGKQKLNIWNYDLKKVNSLLNIYGLTHIKDNQQISNIANIIHNNENTLSNITFKHILNDNSSAVFDVKSTINEKANHAKAFQSSQTILLSDNARINAQPRLQIYTDELEAKHSATTGAIDKEQLYYLKSRGISHENAIKILLESFEAEILEKITNEKIREFIKEITAKGFKNE